MSAKKEKKSKERDETLVVGLGASAGGLETLGLFFDSLPEKTGMAFIVVVHLAPDQKSNMAELLQNHTSLKVRKVAERTEIERDNVYVIPPDKQLSVENNHLTLTDPDKKHSVDTVNLLFRTLAEKKGKHAAGVILSGTGTDGTVGMKAIKERGGIAIAQDPDEAKHPGMPKSVINTGVVDKILSVREIAEELLEYKENLFQICIPDEIDSVGEEGEILSKIFSKIRSETSHDFNNYRRSSVLRRIDRRMRVNRVHSLSEYLTYLDEHPDEVDELFKDLLISVTNFFRDPEAFEVLEKQVIPKLFEDKGRNDQLRVWVPGCATGEEAYSIAMLLQEHATERDYSPEIQIFASDIDEEALDTARKGVYPDSIAGDLTETRLRRFLKKEDNTYRVKKEIRDMVLFASHDLLRTPPFSKQDLIACRNLLIYLNRDLQSEVFNLFHYALRPEGWLFLGTSDSRIGTKNLFTPVDKEHRIYRQKPSSHTRTPLPDMPLLYNKPYVTRSSRNTPDRQKKNIEKLHWSILARLYAPQSVLITPDYEVIHSTDGINKYLQYKGGEPSRNILDMVKPEIQQALRGMLFQLQKEKIQPAQKKVRISLEDSPEKLELIARKFSDAELREGVIHVVFKEIQDSAKASSAKDRISDDEIPAEEAEIIESLERELEYTKEQLQLSIEEYETSNEELRASNEELQSMNEELQTTTEELETSQEELRSVNEELETVNEELQNKVKELSRAHSDLETLMEATEVGIIFVDNDLCVRRFTSTSAEIFNLIPSDEGRPLDHITHSLEYDEILDDVKHVLESLDKVKKVVSSKDGRWFIMRLRPYRSTENKIEGVVLTFTEFTELKEARETIEEQSYRESLATLGLYALEQDDLEAIMHRAIQQSCSLLQLDAAVIAMLNEEESTFRVASEAGCGCEGVEIEKDNKWDLGYSLGSQKPVSVLDYTKESRFEISPVMADCDFTSSAHIAIRGSGKTYGVVGFYSNELQDFAKRDLDFIQVVANIIGMAIERNRTREVLEETNKQLHEEVERSKQYQKDLLNNSVVERWELGGYLHDNLAQSLVAIKISLDDISKKLAGAEIDVSKEIGQAINIIDEGISQIRDLTHDIIPIDIEEKGVAQAFRLLMRRTTKLHNINCELEAGEVIDKVNNRKLATSLYHVIQEAVKNAALHGKAENIMVSVDESIGNLVLKVEDDGVGISNSAKHKDGKGIRIMKHRMELLGGTCRVENISPDSGKTGTLVTCTIPLAYVTENGEQE